MLDHGSSCQQLEEEVHNIKRVTSYREVLRRLERWDVALKVRVKDTD